MNIYYPTNYIKYSNWLAVIILIVYLIFSYVYLHKITIDIAIITILFLFIQIKNANKPLISIDENNFTIFSFLGFSNPWKKDVIPLNSIVQVTIRGRYFLTKKVEILYRGANNSNKKLMFYLGYLKDSNKLEAQLLQFNQKPL